MSTPISEPISIAPQANLALYGALDDILAQAIEEGDAETAALVNQYLPGAVEYPGWSNELREIFGPAQPRGASIGETVAATLNEILASDARLLTPPDLANLIYVIGALSHFEAADPGGNASLFRDVISLAGEEEISESDRLERAGLFLSMLGEGLYGWQAWPQVIKSAADEDWVKDIIAAVPQCSTSVVTSGGLECVAIDVEIRSDEVALADLLAVVDPRNWPKAYPGFFCEMSGAADRVPPDQWWNVRETVGFCSIAADGGLGLRQRLRFLKSNQAPGDHRLDFDLAEDQDGCTGRVLVDKGFVNMSCTNPYGDITAGGVRLRTKKVAHIQGISPYAQAFWLCKLGYGWVALQLFFGKAYRPALRPPPGYVKWEDEPLIDEPYSDPPDDKDDDEADDGAQVVAAANGAPPADEKTEVATKTAKRLADVANFMTKTHLDLTEKWLKGSLSFGDLEDYGRKVGGRLASEPWEWLKDITTPTKPSKPPGGNP
jgi:hypothetical protein